MMASDRSTAMVHFKYKTFSEEVCRPVTFIGGKDELRDAILTEFSDVLPVARNTRPSHSWPSENVS